MKKVIVLSTVLGLSAMGMACGESSTNVNINANRPANNANSMMADNSMTTTTPAMTPANTMSTNMGNGSMSNTGNMNSMSNRPAGNTSASPSATNRP